MEETIFEKIKHINEYWNEYWSARELYKILEYSKFLPVIENAKIACKNSSDTVLDHFAEVSEMIQIATGTVRETNREIKNYHLSRLACWVCYFSKFLIYGII